MLIALQSIRNRYTLFKLASLALVITASVIFTPLFAYAHSLPPALAPTRPFFIDLNGDRLDSVEAGRQVMITTTFRNTLETELTFVGLIEVRDIDGVTEFLAYQSGTVEPLGNKTVGLSWLVQNSTAYQSRTFAITDFENPQVLSNVQTSRIEVR